MAILKVEIDKETDFPALREMLGRMGLKYDIGDEDGKAFLKQQLRELKRALKMWERGVYISMNMLWQKLRKH